ncbi:MAG: penicillin-binding protein 2 [Actinomycetia bacterium]|nr:penicillin-binding protein 2 [Actinomycetes bacterium]
MEPRPSGSRFAVLGVVTIGLFASLFLRLWFLQVSEAPAFEAEAATLRNETIYTQAPRGRILDAQGRVLVGNRESLVVTLDRGEFRDLPGSERDDLLLELSRELVEGGLPVKVVDLEARIADPRYDQLKPVPLAEDIELELWLKLAEGGVPAIEVERRFVRTYPYGPRLAHVLGYVGAVNQAELDSRVDDPKRYEPGDEIGKTGVEALFEADLRGQPEEAVLELDATRIPVRTVSHTPAMPGNDVKLTIDIDLQAYVEDELALALIEARLQEIEEPDDPPFVAPAGAAVVLDPRTGAVLAIASFPTYDPTEFLFGISQARFEELRDEDNHAPLINRAIQSVYAPGSTFKPVTAYASVMNGARPADFWYTDDGSHALRECNDESGKCRFYNAQRAVLGPVDLAMSLTRSSDDYYYSLSEALYLDYESDTVLQEAARAWGVGEQTGLALPGEVSGFISDPEFKSDRSRANPDVFPYKYWLVGDSVNLGIGQGDMGLTPIQIASIYGAFGRGGQRVATSLASEIIGPDGETVREFEVRDLTEVFYPEAVADPILRGLRGVTINELGTAYEAFSGFPLNSFAVAGKTGTAQVNGKADTALFAAWAPATEPRFAVAVVLEEAGFGSRSAAPLVRRILEPLAGVIELPAARRTSDPEPEPDPAEEDAGEGDATADDGGSGQDESAPSSTSPPASSTTAPPAATTTAPTTTTAVPTTTTTATTTTAVPPSTATTEGGGGG